MKIFFKPSFIKDFKKLPTNIQSGVHSICTEIFPKFESLSDSMGIRIEMIQGFKRYYRIRVGDYRIGLKEEKGKIIFMRVLHRKDIYRYFP